MYDGKKHHTCSDFATFSLKVFATFYLHVRDVCFVLFVRFFWLLCFTCANVTFAFLLAA